MAVHKHHSFDIFKACMDTALANLHLLRPNAPSSHLICDVCDHNSLQYFTCWFGKNAGVSSFRKLR